jgi:hypothetical protein
MASHNWELVRDLGLAQAWRDEAKIQKLIFEIWTGQSICSHVANPDPKAAPDFPLMLAGLSTDDQRCYKCGAAMSTEAKPGLAKTRSLSEIKRVSG